MKNKTIILAYSGGLDTSFCLKRLSSDGLDVHAILINTGGFGKPELNNIKKCLELYSSKESNHKCANCGFSSIRHFWQCQSCHQWSSINKSTLTKSKNDHYVV